MAVQTLMQVRRGSLTQWNSAAQTLGAGILYQGELGYETDSGRFKIGDGSTPWTSLPYASVVPSGFIGGSGISVTQGSNGSTLTISLSDPTIQVGDITDFNEGVDDRVAALLQAGTNISLNYDDAANTLTINSSLGLEEVQDAIGTYVSGVSGISVNYNDTTGYTTISLTDPTVQLADITDLSASAKTFLDTPSSSNLASLVSDETGSGSLVFASGATLTNTVLAGSVTIGSDSLSETIDDRVSNLLTTGSGVGLNYNDETNTLQVSVTGIPTSLITNFASGVNALIENAVSTTIVGGSGIDIVYNSGTNTLNISSALTAGSGISLTHNSGNYTVSLSDPTVQLADVTDLSSDARTFLLTPNSSNLKSLVTDETGSGSLVFASGATLDNVTLSGNVTIGSDSLSEVIEDTIGSKVVGGSGITVSYNDTNGNTTVSLTDPTVQLADITDLTSGARDFLLTPSSSNLSSLVSDETGSGSLVFANNPTLSGVTVNGNLTIGGSGLVSTNINDFHTAVRSSRLDQMSAPSSDVSFNNVKITNLAAPTSDNDAATKAYVDAARMGLDVKASVRVATTANITLSGTQSIDGISVIAGDRVLVKNQSAASENGIYVVAAGSWSRASDANSDAKVTTGLFTFVSEGTAHADSGWVLTTNDTIILDTTNLAFAQFSGAGQITAGNGLTKTGNTIDVVGTAGRIVVNADSVDLDTVSQSDSSGSAGTSFVQSVTRDSYGRVTGITTGSVQDASTSAKGIASFDSNDFSVTSGAVSIKTSGVDNSQLANSSVTIGSSSVSLGGTLTSVSGLTSVSSTNFVGDLSGTATNTLNIEVDVATSGTNNLVFVNGTDGNLKPVVNDKLRINLTDNELLGSSNTTPTLTLKYFIVDGGTP